MINDILQKIINVLAFWSLRLAPNWWYRAIGPKSTYHEIDKWPDRATWWNGRVICRDVSVDLVSVPYDIFIAFLLFLFLYPIVRPRNLFKVRRHVIECINHDIQFCSRPLLRAKNEVVLLCMSILHMMTTKLCPLADIEPRYFNHEPLLFPLTMATTKLSQVYGRKG